MNWVGLGIAAASLTALSVVARTMFRRWTQRALDQQATQLAKTFEANVLKLVDAKKTKIDAGEASKEEAIEKMDAKELEREINE